jgi:hypothetical protein
VGGIADHGKVEHKNLHEGRGAQQTKEELQQTRKYRARHMEEKSTE